jgi:hypothetical protein
VVLRKWSIAEVEPINLQTRPDTVMGTSKGPNTTFNPGTTFIAGQQSLGFIVLRLLSLHNQFITRRASFCSRIVLGPTTNSAVIRLNHRTSLFTG